MASLAVATLGAPRASGNLRSRLSVRSHSPMRVVPTLSLFRKGNIVLQLENDSFSLVSALRPGTCEGRL